MPRPRLLATWSTLLLDDGAIGGIVIADTTDRTAVPGALVIVLAIGTALFGAAAITGRRGVAFLWSPTSVRRHSQTSRLAPIANHRPAGCAGGPRTR